MIIFFLYLKMYKLYYSLYYFTIPHLFIIRGKCYLFLIICLSMFYLGGVIQRVIIPVLSSKNYLSLRINTGRS